MRITKLQRRHYDAIAWTGLFARVLPPVEEFRLDAQRYLIVRKDTDGLERGIYAIGEDGTAYSVCLLITRRYRATRIAKAASLSFKER